MRTTCFRGSSGRDMVPGGMALHPFEQIEGHVVIIYAQITISWITGGYSLLLSMQQEMVQDL